MMKQRFIRAGFTFLCAVILLAGCSSSPAYQSGSYVGRSGLDDTGAYGEVTLVIDGDSRITDCRFVTWQADGAIKDEDYGKVNGEISNQDFYDKAQLAVAAMEQYARQYVEVQQLSDVDAVSGATIAYNQFIEAVEDALAQASQ
jgi:major membrane immunogen (membrane-anchored lipoprotein)